MSHPPEEQPVPTDHWYVALRSAMVVGPTPCIARVAGRELAVWREPQGQIRSSDGSTALVEAHGYVWACLGQRPPDLPALPEPIARAGYVCHQRTVRVKANYRLALENSLDFSHGAFVHPFTQPSWWLHRLARERHLETTYRPTPHGLYLEGRLNGKLTYTHEFTLPDRLRLVVLPDSRWAIDLVVYHVPEDAAHCRMEILFGRRALWASKARLPIYKPGTLLIHRQDIRIIEAQQRARHGGLPPREEHCAADGFTLLLRHILDAAAEGAWPPADTDASAMVSRRILIKV